jgi:DNA-binding MarR family transcriptional regulator
MKTKAPIPIRVADFQRLLDQVTQVTDRANVVRQRCSGLGRMECLTLQILERFRQRKEELRRRIAQRRLSPEELALHLPRCMRQSYLEGGLRREQLETLPRDLSMKALAEEIGVACSRMTRIGDTLSDEVDPLSGQPRGKGLIHREPSPDDRRVILIRITEAGSRRVRDQDGHAGRMARILLKRIPAAEQEGVRQGLERYCAALESALPELQAALGGVEECDNS